MLKESKHFERSVAAASNLKNCTMVNCDCSSIVMYRSYLHVSHYLSTPYHIDEKVRIEVLKKYQLYNHLFVMVS